MANATTKQKKTTRKIQPGYQRTVSMGTNSASAAKIKMDNSTMSVSLMAGQSAVTTELDRGNAVSLTRPAFPSNLYTFVAPMVLARHLAISLAPISVVLESV